MVKCYLCGDPLKWEDCRFWILPLYMDHSKPICDSCAIKKQPELTTTVTGFIGVKI